LPVAGRYWDGRPVWPGARIEGERFHILTFLGEWWGSGVPRFPDELVVGYTRHVNAHGGIVTWDTPIAPNGLLPQSFVDQLSTLEQSVASR